MQSMNFKLISVVTAVLLLTASASLLIAQAKPAHLKPGVDFSGPHFNLNVHGVPAGVDKFFNDSTGHGRHSIFVPLTTADEGGNPYNITIQYAFSQDLNWTVLDCDATGEGHNASIILPAYMYLDTNGDGIEDVSRRVKYYFLYVVGLGKPKEMTQVIVYPEAQGNASWTAYHFYEDPLIVEGHQIGGKGKGTTGQPTWYNGTGLFFADVTFWNGTDTIEYVNQWVFDIPGLEDYWWNVNNDGVKLLKLRFYPVFK